MQGGIRIILERVRQYIDLRRFSHRQKIHFIINITVGFIIAFISVILENSTWGHRNINLQYDTFIVQEASGVDSHHDPRISPELIFFDIDDITYRQWGRPAVTPRDKVADLMEIAYKGEAKVIVSDISFEEPDYSPQHSLGNDEPLLDGKQREQRLWQVLNDIKKLGGQTKVILPSSLYVDKTLRPNVFYDLIDNSVIFQAAPAVMKDQYDNIVRYWIPFQEYNDANGQRKILWSSPLLATVLAKGDKVELDNYAEKIITNLVKKEETFAIHMADSKKPIKFYAEDGVHHQYNRIRFLLLPANTLTPRGTLYAVNQRRTSSGKDVFTTIRPAEFSLKDKIVIIGNSSPDYNDMHMTPVGYIPGMYIQGNAINTLLHNKQTSMVYSFWKWLSEIILIIITSYAFLYFYSFSSQLLLSAFLICLAPLFYLLFLHTGIFFDLAFPLIGIGFHELFAKMEHIMAKNKTH